MQCGCPVCGTLMAQSQKGLESRCVCPACAHNCSICLGTDCALDRSAVAALQDQIPPPAFPRAGKPV